ncbi:MAG: c-type cytochrome [Rhizobiales bacterium]|nr:c-type cytochrome [Hyphomicrobiales bacterium]
MSVALLRTILLLLLSHLYWAEAQAQGNERGKEIFKSATPSCAICHTLADAGATGEIGPNLDELKPTDERVRKAVQSGVGVMPGYDASLSDAEIAAVAQYIAQATK